MKAAIAILIFSACFFWIFSNDGCSLYLPDLYASSELDTLFIDSFILVNTNECDSAQVSETINWIADQWPAFIVGIDVKNDRIFEWGEALDASIVFCDGEASMERTSLFKSRLALLDFDTTHIPQKAYINFLNGDFNYLPVVPCDNYQKFAYQDKIVIMGNMGVSYMKPMYNNGPSSINIPEVNGSDKIFKTQILALILHSIIRKDAITEAPLILTLFFYAIFCLLIFFLTSIIFRKTSTFLIRYGLVKVTQVTIFLLIFLLVFILAPALQYVFKVDAFIPVLLVGAEIVFWMFFFFARVAGSRARQVS